MLPEVQKRCFTVDEYHRMTEAGILKEDDRVELIQGEIIAMAAIGSFHAACVSRLTERFVGRFSGRAIVWVQNPIWIDPHSEPEPDLALLKPRPDFYAARHPRPEDVLLLVEVSEASLAYDTSFKLPMYAKAGIGEVWIINLSDACVDIYREPSENGHRMMRKYFRGDRLEPLSFPGEAFEVDDMIG